MMIADSTIVCPTPQLGDRLIDRSGQLWTMGSPMTVEVALLAIHAGERFTYEPVKR